MSAYQRPLFRQAGGPAGLEALPPPPPAGVAAIPQQDPQAMVEAAGQMASSEMESVGQDYVLEMMNSLDSAGNFKTVIDALRGNKLPMSERFLELAEYVGEDDAEKTPESVLAMVQPVIMMTEEGNVDSGIGQLMQGLTGEVDMMTDEGDLTDMGQGVGSLMVANQPAPPPQQFANGGAVQHFQVGGGALSGITLPWTPGGTDDPRKDIPSDMLSYFSDPGFRRRLTQGDPGRASRFPGMQGNSNETVDVRPGFPPRFLRRGDAPRVGDIESTGGDVDYQGIMSIYSPEYRTRSRSGVDLFTDVKETLPLYQELFSDLLDPESRRDRTRSTALFNVAKAGLNFAAGVDPTGKSVTHQPVVSQLAAAAGDLPKEMAALGEREYAEEQALNAAALQQTISQVGAERSLEAQLLSREEISRINAYVQAIMTKGSTADMIRLISDQRVVDVWAQGGTDPYFDSALARLFAPQRDELNNLVYPDVPQHIITAARGRLSKNLSVPSNLIEAMNRAIITETATGRAEGGAVQKYQQGGGVRKYQVGAGVFSQDQLATMENEAGAISFEAIQLAGGEIPTNPVVGGTFNPADWEGMANFPGYTLERRADAQLGEYQYQLVRRPTEPADQPIEPEIMSGLEGADISEATGPWNWAKGLGNFAVDIAAGLLSKESQGWTPAPVMRRAHTAMNAWNSQLDFGIKNSLVNRDNATIQATIDNLKLPTGIFATTIIGDDTALERLKATRELLDGEITRNQNVLNRTAVQDSERAGGERSDQTLRGLRVELDQMIGGYEMLLRGTDPRDWDLSDFHRAPTEGSQ